MEEIFLHIFAEKLELLGYSKRAIADYPAYVRLFLRYCEERENLTSILDIRPEHITAYAAWLQYSKLKKGNYLTSTTIHCRLGILKTFYRMMYREGALPHDYAPLITIPKKRRSLPRNVPNEKEMKALLEYVAPVDPISKRDRCILELLYATGLRSEELRTITLDNLDLSGKTLFVHGKGAKDRIVPVGDWVMPYLREYLEAARPRLLNPGEPTDLLFISKNGKAITFGNLGDLIRKYAKAAGLEHKITPHTLRHACATHLLKGGADIRYVQELLGHSDLSSTQIYTQIDITFLKEAHRKYHPRERLEEGT